MGINQTKAQGGPAGSGYGGDPGLPLLPLTPGRVNGLSDFVQSILRTDN